MKEISNYNHIEKMQITSQSIVTFPYTNRWNKNKNQKILSDRTFDIFQLED